MSVSVALGAPLHGLNSGLVEHLEVVELRQPTALGPDINPQGDRDLFDQLCAAYRLTEQAGKAQAYSRKPPRGEVRREQQPVRPLVRRGQI